MNVVQVFSIVTGRNRCVSYVGRLLGFVANQSYGRGKWGEVSSKPVSIESFPKTFSLLALIDDQADGCWSWTLVL